jgi:hypothetical protein
MNVKLAQGKHGKKFISLVPSSYQPLFAVSHVGFEHWCEFFVL